MRNPLKNMEWLTSGATIGLFTGMALHRDHIIRKSTFLTNTFKPDLPNADYKLRKIGITTLLGAGIGSVIGLFTSLRAHHTEDEKSGAPIPLSANFVAQRARTEESLTQEPLYPEATNTLYTDKIQAERERLSGNTPDLHFR